LVALLIAVPAALGAKYAGEPFSLGVGGRPLALGGATVAGPFDATAGYWNPAGLNGLSGRQVMAMHSETFGSLLNHDFVAYVDSRRDSSGLIGAFGCYLYYLGGDGIYITDRDNSGRTVIVGEESHADVMFGAAVSGQLMDKLEYGLTARLIYRDLAGESGKGLSFDGGLLYHARTWATLGLMVNDITTGFVRYSGETFGRGAYTESIYPTARPGLLLERCHNDFVGRFAFSGEIRFEDRKYSDQYWTGAVSADTHFGWEVEYRKLVSGRFGFNGGKFTAGLGVSAGRAVFDFAFQNNPDFDETYRVSAGYAW